MPIVPASAIIPQLAQRLTAFCGFSKGSGKTTAFSWALRALHAYGPVSLMTIGTHHSATAAGSDARNSHTALPQLRLMPGDLALTTLPQAKLSPASFEIMAIVPGRTSQGRLIIGRAQRSGCINLIGPEHFSSLRYAADLILRERWSKTILLDGAASRITQLSALPSLQFIYTMQIAPDNISSSLERLKMLEELVRLEKKPASVSYAGESPANAISIAGPLTDSIAEELPRHTDRLVIDDFSKVFLSAGQWQRLIKNTAVYVRRRIPMLGVLIIGREIERRELLSQLNDFDMPIFINPLEYQAMPFS